MSVNLSDYKSVCDCGSMCEYESGWACTGLCEFEPKWQWAWMSEGLSVTVGLCAIVGLHRPMWVASAGV